MSFHSSSSIFDGFFSLPSRALYVPSFTSNDIICIFHNKKLDFPSSFSTSNLVFVIVLLAIALIPIVVIYHGSNNRKTPNWQLGNGNFGTDLPLANKRNYLRQENQRTPDLTWFDNVPTSIGRRGEIFIEKREENTRVTRISLSQLSMMEISLCLNTPLKGQPQGVYIGPRIILVQSKFQ